MRPVVLGGEDIKNVIPESAATPPPRTRQQPFDYEGEVYVGTPTEEGEEEEEEEDNQLNPRGDVFSESLFLFGGLAINPLWVVRRTSSDCKQIQVVSAEFLLLRRYNILQLKKASAQD